MDEIEDVELPCAGMVLVVSCFMFQADDTLLLNRCIKEVAGRFLSWRGFD